MVKCWLLFDKISTEYPKAKALEEGLWAPLFDDLAIPMQDEFAQPWPYGFRHAQKNPQSIAPFVLENHFP